MFFFLGVAPDDPERVHPNRSPRFWQPVGFGRS